MFLNARAKTVLPPPGAPRSSTLCPPVAAMINALFAFSRPYIWEKVVSSWKDSVGCAGS